MSPYNIEVKCDYAEWWRYNVFIMAVGYNSLEERIGFYDLADQVYDIGGADTSRSKPEDYPEPRVVTMTTGECDHIELYLYVIANTFPDSPVIKNSPSFEIQLAISAGDHPLSISHHEVNQWGGLTIVGKRFG